MKITKQKVQAVSDLKAGYTLGHADVAILNELARIALASLEAEPVAWLWSHRKHPSEVSLVRPEDDERAEGAHWSGWSCQSLYTAPPAPVALPSGYSDFEEIWSSSTHPLTQDDEMKDFAWDIWNACRAAMLQGADGTLIGEGTRNHPEDNLDMVDHSCDANEKGNLPVIPDWQTQAEKMAELYGSSFVLFRNGESPQCADPTKVIISFTDEGLGHGSAAPQQEA
ncbi:TPA: hypothetical protein ACIRVD_002068 [Enterobacter roggenkampii]